MLYSCNPPPEKNAPCGKSMFVLQSAENCNIILLFYIATGMPVTWGPNS